MTRIGRYILFAWLLVLPYSALAQDMTERDMINRADDALSRSDYPAAVASLDQVIQKYPESKNEQVFQSLAKVCDSYAVDFEKAVSAYRLYQQRFPEGRFRARFRDRLDYLESRRADWPALQRFVQLQGKFDRKNPGPAIQEAESILHDFPNTTIKPGVCLWLGTELYKSEQYRPARNYLDIYLQNVPNSDNSHLDRVNALVAYVEVALKLKDYTAAENKLAELRTIEPNRQDEFNVTLDKVKTKRRYYYAFCLSILIAVVELLGAALLRPWANRVGRTNIKQLTRQMALVVACTVAPYGLLLARGERVPPTFLALAGFGCAGLLIVRLTSPIHVKIGRLPYIVLSSIMMCCLIYMAFYLTDMAKMFLWPIEELHRHG